MPIRHHAQRKHLIHSLNSLLYQLHSLSFFLAPSLLAFLCRCGTQFQFARPRDFDKRRSLRFWFLIIMFVNLGSVWSHATAGAPEGKNIILDFVGMGRRPSKAQLLWLDFTIIFLEMVLSAIAFETSLANDMPDETPDPLYISPDTETIFDSEEQEPMLPTTTEDTESTPLASHPAFQYPPKRPAANTSHLPPREPIMNLTLSHVYHRLTTPTPIPPPRPLDLDNLEETLRRFALPLPATSRASRVVSRAINVLQRARAQELERSSGERLAGPSDAVNGQRSSSTRIPGAIADDDDAD